MFKNFLLVKLLTELVQGVSASFNPTTANNHVLVGHVFQQMHAKDWFNCIQACHDEARCISYNYDKSAGENGLCELSNAGVGDLCNEDTSLAYFVGFVFQQLREGKCHKSCKEIQHYHSNAVSGLYKIRPLPNAKPIEVYCELEIEGGGFTFLPGSLTLRPDAQRIVDALFKDKRNVLLMLRKQVDRTQAYTLIQLHPNFAKTDFGVLINSYTGYTPPKNKFMRNYIFLGIIPAFVAKSKGSQGFRSNGNVIQFNNCDANPNSLFAFMPNFSFQTSSSYASGSHYEDHGLAVKWRSKGIFIRDRDRMPNKFYFLTELHFGGCGCYTSSNRWKDGFNAAAIGIR